MGKNNYKNLVDLRTKGNLMSYKNDKQVKSTSSVGFVSPVEDDEATPLSPSLKAYYESRKTGIDKKYEKKVPISPEIQRAIMAQIVDYKVAPVEEYVKPATYVVASNGTFVVKKTPFGNITVKVKEMPYLPEMEQGFKLELPKVPYNLFLQAFSFFKAVSDETKDEAALVLYYNTETQEYENLCPVQEVSGAAVTFGKDKDYLLRMIDAKYIRVCELHSHNTMSAFHSGTDDGDEIFDCSFIVFGKLDTLTPEHIFSYAASGVRVDSTIWDLFERPSSHIDLGGGVIIEQLMETPLLVEIEYPAEWHDNLTRYVYQSTVSSYTYGKSYMGIDGLDPEDDWEDSEWDKKYGYKNYYADRDAEMTLEDKKEQEDLDAEINGKLHDEGTLKDASFVDDDEESMLDEPGRIQLVLDNLEEQFGTQALNTLTDGLMDRGFGSPWAGSGVSLQ